MTTHLSVFAEYRGYLFSLAQRILGSAIDAEDLLQETFIRWQQTSLAQIRSPKAFLATVSNVFVLIICNLLKLAERYG